MGFDLVVIGYNLSENKVLFETKLKNGEPQNIQASRTDPNILYALNHNCVFIINNGKIEAEHTLDFEARAFAVSENEYYLGDRVNI